MTNLPDDPAAAGHWVRKQRTDRGWSGTELARRINGMAEEEGDTTRVSQQVIAKFEAAKNKRIPPWVRYVAKVVEAADDETAFDPYLSAGKTDTSVAIRLVPGFAGLGAGGTGEGDEGEVSFSRDLVENDLKAPAEALLAMVAEGNSMEPDFRGGDQILIDTRRKTLAQPGAFCLWDGDGHVIKYLEKIDGSEPPRIRIISKNMDLYNPRERMLDEINIVGRVVWYGRRVQ